MKYYLTIPTGVLFIVILFAAICQYKRKRKYFNNVFKNQKKNVLTQ